jgi:hypothetical protein
MRYSTWQVSGSQQLLPDLPRLFVMLSDDRWRLFRFLQQHHSEFRGTRARDFLWKGRVDGVPAAAENTAIGAFA